MITALLIDDDSNLRNGMKSLLARYAPEIRIIGEADSVETGAKIVLQNRNRRPNECRETPLAADFAILFSHRFQHYRLLL